MGSSGGIIACDGRKQPGLPLADQLRRLSVIGFGGRHGLIRDFDLGDQPVQLRFMINRPPCATIGEVRRRDGLPALSFLEVRAPHALSAEIGRRDRVRPDIIRPQGAARQKRDQHARGSRKTDRARDQRALDQAYGLSPCRACPRARQATGAPERPRKRFCANRRPIENAGRARLSLEHPSASCLSRRSLGASRRTTQETPRKSTTKAFRETETNRRGTFWRRRRQRQTSS